MIVGSTEGIICFKMITYPGMPTNLAYMTYSRSFRDSVSARTRRAISIHKTKVEAVRGASIHVDDGDILAVVGESGSGKSVLMKSIMGLLPENAQTTADSLVY